METADKRYKFINGETGYVIHYHTCKLPKEQTKQELENVKTWVAVKNNILVSTIYWEEIKE
jgi:hypothetical protein